VKPRVLHAVEQFLSRSETFIYTYVTGHQRYDASVICNVRANAVEFPFPDVHVCPKPESKRSLDWWLSMVIEQATGRSPWRRRVEAVLADVKPAIVHAHFGPTACEIVAITRAAGLPLVTSMYGVDAAVLPYLPQWSNAYERLFTLGDVFLAEGPEMRRKIIAAGAPADRVVIQPIALRLDRYPPWAPDPVPTVLFVGRFVDKKGLEDAVTAFARARLSVTDARMTVVGAGPDGERARALVSALGLSDVVTFVGTKPHADVLARMAGAHVLLHPSRTAGDGDSEGGAPTILLEAQAIGMPIVTTRHADIPNVVPKGPGVFLCDERDVDGLARGLVAALQQHTGSSPAYVAAHHDVRKTICALEELYTMTVEDHARGALAAR
jgi:colanic acid/amylovoran biosynthesis glycosyltransferase